MRILQVHLAAAKATGAALQRFYGDQLESPDSGPFAPTELLGVCEIGLVGYDTPAMARALEALGIKDAEVTLPGTPHRVRTVAGR